MRSQVKYIGRVPAHGVYKAELNVVDPTILCSNNFHEAKNDRPSYLVREGRW